MAYKNSEIPCSIEVVGDYDRQDFTGAIRVSLSRTRDDDRVFVWFSNGQSKTFIFESIDDAMKCKMFINQHIEGRCVMPKPVIDTPKKGETKMLVLTRKVGESIILMIGEELVEIMVSDVHGGKVKIGIHAAKSVKILRKELTERKQEGER